MLIFQERSPLKIIFRYGKAMGEVISASSYIILIKPQQRMPICVADHFIIISRVYVFFLEREYSNYSAMLMHHTSYLETCRELNI
ncbi:hypothetical protein CW706_01340 [Candidatus Bathyarchaeota archaeon]|nr:MAG: hypothetical protein CW706_01340 [Candidatus Bathyarchaeota archaeon]